MPFAQSLSPNVTLGVRTTQDPASMLKTVTSAVHSADPQAALSYLGTLDQMKDQSFGNERFLLQLYAAFAAVALLLAAIGIYGLIAFSVSQRTREIGVRIALGANRPRVIGMIVREALLLALVGLTLGFAAAAIVGQSMHSLLYQVAPIDWPVLVGAAVLLLATALIASYGPARRASAIDPMVALRTE